MEEKIRVINRRNGKERFVSPSFLLKPRFHKDWYKQDVLQHEAKVIEAIEEKISIEKEPPVPFEKITVMKLKEILKDKKIAFLPSDNKKQLYSSYINTL